MTDKKYCIMDMDGTLIDSMPYWNTLSPDYLVERGITKSTEGLVEILRTMTMPQACVYLKKEYDLPETSEEILRQLNQVMRRHYAEDIPLKKNVREHLDMLQEEGAKLSVVTATALPLVHLCLQRLGVEDYVVFIMSCEEVGCGKDRLTLSWKLPADWAHSPGTFTFMRIPIQPCRQQEMPDLRRWVYTIPIPAPGSSA